MSFKKIKNILNEEYNYDDSYDIEDVIKELETLQQDLHQYVSDDEESSVVNHHLESALSKLRKFLDGRE